MAAVSLPGLCLTSYFGFIPAKQPANIATSYEDLVNL